VRSGETAQGSERERLWSSVARFVVAVVVAIAVCELIWRHVGNRLSIVTDIVGYPIFADFDAYRYQFAFELVTWAFPVLTVLVYLLLAWRGPIRRRSPIRRIRPVLVSRAVVTSEDRADERWDSRADARDAFWSVVRVAFPGTVVAIELSAATGSNEISLWGLMTGAAYVALVLAGACVRTSLALHGRRHGSRGRTSHFESNVSVVNSLFGPVAVLVLLYFVSRATTVTIGSPHRVVYYPWLPLWLVICVVVVSVVWTTRALRRSSLGRSPRLIEGSILVTVVGCAAILLATASLPGALGQFGGFDDAQFLAGAQLVFVHGLLPWRDIYLLHGLLEDVFAGAVGMAVFSHSRWGSVAGQMMIIYPIQSCVWYLFAVYFSRRNRLVPVIVGMLIVGGYLTASFSRFALLPLVLILFDKMVRTPRKLWCFAFAIDLVIQAIITPEIGLLAGGVIATLVAFEWLGHVQGQSIAKSFYRTFWCGVFGLGLVLCFGCYLAGTNSLGAFLSYYEMNIGSHILWGGIPITWWNVANIRTVMFFCVPVLLYLVTFWRAAGKLSGGKSWSSDEWTMVASATFVVLYSQKSLDRADPSHVAEVFTVCVPLTILWGIDAIMMADRLIVRMASGAFSWLQRRLAEWESVVVSGLRLARESPRVASVLMVALLPVITPGVVTAIADVPGAMHASAAAGPPMKLLGYTQTGAVDVQQIQDLGKFLDAYAGPTSPVFDFANEPGVLYFLLNRVPGSRFFHVEMAESTQAQQLVIAELERSRPRLVIFANGTFGLPGTEYDGILGMIRNYQISRYLLTHYVPFADVDGQVVMLRQDLVGKVRSPMSVGVPAVTTGLYFEPGLCNWGAIPNFLRVPASVEGSTGVKLGMSTASQISEVILGWAVDDLKLQPAKEVVAVRGDRVIASVKPNVFRPDVAAYLLSKATSYSGFILKVPSGSNLERLEIYALNANGTATRVLSPPSLSSPVDTGPTRDFIIGNNGVKYRVQANERASGSGFIDNVGYLYSLSLPAGIDRSEYSWLRLSFKPPLRDMTVEFADALESPGHQIALSVLAANGRNVNVDVGACSQWYGYRSNRIMLIESIYDPIVSARLVR